MRVMLTQSEQTLAGLAPALEALGHDVLRWPLIRTVPLPEPELTAAAERLRRCRWLLFSSPASVRALGLLGGGSAAPCRESLCGAVGPGTARALQDAGCHVALVGSGDAASLASAFLAHPLATGPVGLPLGDRARKTLERALTAGGHEVVTAVVYKTEVVPTAAGTEHVRPSGDGEEDDRASGLAAEPDGQACEPPDVVLLASPSAVSALPAWLAERAVLVALGATTAEAVRAAGHGCRVAQRPTVDAVLDSVTGVMR